MIIIENKVVGNVYTVARLASSLNNWKGPIFSYGSVNPKYIPTSLVSRRVPLITKKDLVNNNRSIYQCERSQDEVQFIHFIDNKCDYHVQ